MCSHISLLFIYRMTPAGLAQFSFVFARPGSMHEARGRAMRRKRLQLHIVGIFTLTYTGLLHSTLFHYQSVDLPKTSEELLDIPMYLVDIDGRRCHRKEGAEA